MKNVGGIRIKYSLFMSDFNETWIFSTVFRKYSNIKFHENPFSGSRVVPCGQKDGRTDMKKLIVVFRISADAPIQESKIANLEYFYFKTFDKISVKNV
jgi:hypothetical protein